MNLGFGIVGCGMISEFHCRALADVKGAKFIGCVSQRIESAEGLATKFGGKVYRSLEELLADRQVDVVSICTPSGAHLEIAVAAAQSGKHVLVEKPLEITLKRCDAIIQACQQHGVQLATIFPSRFHASSNRLKKAIEAGRFGRLTLGDAYVKWYRTQAYYDSGQWRGTWELDGGGALMNQAIHSVDLLTWLMGPVATVTAQSATLAHERIEVEDTVVATLQFANQALGVIEASTAVYPGSSKKIEIHGTHGSACLEDEIIKNWSFAKPTAADQKLLLPADQTHAGGAGDPSSIGHAAHAAQFRNFVTAIKTGTSPAVSGAEGRTSVEVVLAIYQAAATGKQVTLPLKRDPRRS